jgi:hypothetical protein
VAKIDLLAMTVLLGGLVVGIQKFIARLASMARRGYTWS